MGRNKLEWNPFSSSAFFSAKHVPGRAAARIDDSQSTIDEGQPPSREEESEEEAEEDWLNQERRTKNSGHECPRSL